MTPKGREGALSENLPCNDLISSWGGLEGGSERLEGVVSKAIDGRLRRWGPFPHQELVAHLEPGRAAKE